MNLELLTQLWAKLVQLNPHVLTFTAAILLIMAVILALLDRIAAGSLVAALFVVVALFHFPAGKLRGIWHQSEVA